VTFNDFQPDGSVQAVFSGQLLNDGGQAPITGFCYSTSPNPTVNDNVLNSYLVLSTTGTLLPNTTYYVRAYATNVAGTSYGNQVTYTTPAVQLATVVTNPVGSLNPAPGPSYYTYFYGQLTNNGGTIFTQWGYCYSTSPNPTINDILISDGQPAYGLSVGQTYYVRAYATNSAGTSYGNEITFSTPAITIPVVATYPATDIFSEFATFNGELIDDGADNWGGFSSGFCYSTSPNPTINDAVIYVYAAVPSPLMQTPVMDLLPNTTYYVRAFGQNSVGTGYGNEVNFTTLP
jgi:hypothetical protein